MGKTIPEFNGTNNNGQMTRQINLENQIVGDRHGIKTRIKNCSVSLQTNSGKKIIVYIIN